MKGKKHAEKQFTSLMLNKSMLRVYWHGVVCHCVILHGLRSSRHLSTYRQGLVAWRPCSCYCTTERRAMRRRRTSTRRCTLPSRRATRTSSRFSSTVEPNTTPSHGYHLFALLFLTLHATFRPLCYIVHSNVQFKKFLSVLPK